MTKISPKLSPTLLVLEENLEKVLGKVSGKFGKTSGVWSLILPIDLVGATDEINRFAEINSAVFLPNSEPSFQFLHRRTFPFPQKFGQMTSITLGPSQSGMDFLSRVTLIY